MNEKGTDSQYHLRISDFFLSTNKSDEPARTYSVISPRKLSTNSLVAEIMIGLYCPVKRQQGVARDL
jgi:hypothetical protein